MPRTPDMSEILRVADSHGSLSEAPGLWKGLVGAWPLQDGGGITAHDVSGYRNHGTLTNMDPATDWVVTEKGRALDFDGSDDAVQIPIPSKLQNLTAMSLSAWINPRTIGGVAADYIFAKDVVGGTGWFLAVYDNSADNLIFQYLSRDGNDCLRVSANSSVTANVWNHVVATYNGGTSASGIGLYVNGKECSYSTSQDGTGSFIGDAGTSVYIGNRVDAGRPVDGSLVLPAIYSRALTPSEIAQLYSDPWAMYRMRRRVFRAGFVTPPRKTLKLRRAAKMRERPSSFTINPQSPLAQGLVFAGLGQAPGSLTMRDASAYGNHGTLTNMEAGSDWVWVPELGRWGLDFDGSNEYVLFPISRVGYLPLTFACWFNIRGTTTERGLMQWGDALNDTNPYMLLQQNAASTARWFVDGGYRQTVTFGLGWHHWAVSWNKSVWRFWYDGTEQGTGWDDTSPAELNATGLYLANGYNGYNNCICSDPMFWLGVCKTPAEIRALADPSNVDLRIGATPLILPPRTQYYPAVYTEPSPPTQRFKTYRRTTRALRQRPDSFTLDLQHPLAQGLVFAGLGQGQGGLTMRDSSPFQNHGTLTNMAPSSDWQYVPSLGRWGLDFDGTDDTVENLSRAVPAAWTFSAWIYLRAGLTVDFGLTGGSYQFWADVTAGPVWRLGATGTATIYSSTSSDWRGTWTHVAYVFDGTNCTFKINGASDGTAAGVSADTLVRLGATNDPTTKRANGLLSDPCIFRRALSDGEIVRLADPTNAFLSGLIRPTRYFHPVAVPYEKNTAGLPSIFTNRGRIITSG